MSSYKKTACYKSTCIVKETGFRRNDYKVCTTCKEEVSDALFEHIKKYTQKEEKKEDNSNNHTDYSYGFPDDY
jgi:hypothetical protein